MTTKDKKEIVEAFNKLKKEISELRNKLNQLNDVKEKFFSDKKEDASKANDFRKKIFALKRERNELTNSVKQLKEKRDSLNRAIGENIVKLKQMNAEKIETLKKGGMREDPSRISAEINKLEYRIETAGLTFSQEQKVMKEIKTLKKMLGEMKGVTDLFQNLNSLSKETDALKREAEAIHHQIKETANLSQQKHEEMIKVSKELDELYPRTPKEGENEEKKEGEQKEGEQKKSEAAPAEEKPAEEKTPAEDQVDIAQVKHDFNETNELLKQKLGEMNALSTELGEVQQEFFEKRQMEREQKKSKREQKNKEIIEEKQKAVEEKLKKKSGKLTMEDLMAMQMGK